MRSSAVLVENKPDRCKPDGIEQKESIVVREYQTATGNMGIAMH